MKRNGMLDWLARSCAAGIVAVTLGGLLCVTGCGDSDENSGGDDDVDAVSVVGTWGVPGRDTRTVFRADGTWANYRSPDLIQAHCSGTWTQSGLSISGTGENPGVGTLDIEATLSADGNALVYDFIEHWHDPYKHNVYNFVRM